MGVNLDELERLYKAATPGEWHWDADKVKGDPLGRERARICTLGKTITEAYYLDDSGKRDMALLCALHNAFPALLALARDGERHQEMEQKLRAFADAAYMRGIDMATYKAACQGSEAKLASGTFGAEETEAHKQMNRHFGAHFGIYAAIDAARKGEQE